MGSGHVLDISLNDLITTDVSASFCGQLFEDPWPCASNGLKALGKDLKRKEDI
jgi:hypothetical protein